jgi:hypothetical protein
MLTGESHPNWTGDAASYAAVHFRLDRVHGKARDYRCGCGAQAAEWAFDEPVGFSTDLSRYTAMCSSCHKRHDRKVSTSFEHGTLTGYNRHKCRCDSCSEARSIYSASYHAAHRGAINAATRKRRKELQ